jgi:hypothetical protein
MTFSNLNFPAKFLFSTIRLEYKLIVVQSDTTYNVIILIY